jgi:fused signal recognition particle receptor
VQKQNWRDALAQTRRATFGRLATLLGQTDLTDEYWSELESTLVQADLGIQTVTYLLGELQKIAASEGITCGSELKEVLRRLLIERIPKADFVMDSGPPQVIVLVGVNGSGKTTIAARLARQYQLENKKVILAAADTYRAAGGEQLEAWGKRLKVDVIHGQLGSDPGAVVYDAAQAALTRNVDALIIDTSGRMHTSHNLMAELKKICRVAGNVIPHAPHLTYLVLDATTGQNGLSQARAFADQIGIQGIILAKLDSSARGGVGFAVTAELGLPIVYVGLGEHLEDIAPFEPEAYVDGLLEVN